jgi:TolA-binding protein
MSPLRRVPTPRPGDAPGHSSAANSGQSPRSNRPRRHAETEHPQNQVSDAGSSLRTSSSTVSQLRNENAGLQKKLEDAERTIKDLEQQLTLLNWQFKQYRQQDATDERPEKAESQEETLFNVCNHRSMSPYFEMENPRVVSTKGRRYLGDSAQVGDSLSFSDIKTKLAESGRSLEGDRIDSLFPKNTLLIRLANDLADGDRKITLTHLECMASMSQFCTAEEGETAEQNRPFIAPDGTTASMHAFQSAARHNGGNHSLAQGASSPRAAFVAWRDLTPNNALEKISQLFNETWELPPPIRRQQSFNPNVDYVDRQNSRVAEAEMDIQGFGQHKTQMCMIVDKPSFDQANQQDIDNAGRVARKVMQLAGKLDDNGTLEVFSNRPGEPMKLNIRQPGEDLRIASSMVTGDAPDAYSHIDALIGYFYEGDPSAKKHRHKPVFCTFLTKSLSEEKYQLLKKATHVLGELQLPFFLKVVNVSPDLSQEEVRRMSRLDDKTSNDNGENSIDNVDVVHAREPGEITPKNFLREYKGFVAEAHSKGFLVKDQGFDTSEVNIHDEGRV